MFRNINELVLYSRRIISLASVELSLNCMRCFCSYLDQFILGVSLGIRRKFRAACNGEPVDVLDDAAQVIG